MAAAAALNGNLNDIRKVTGWSPVSGKNNTKLDIAADPVKTESDNELERIDDLPEDGQQTGIESMNVPSPGIRNGIIYSAPVNW